MIVASGLAAGLVGLLMAGFSLIMSLRQRSAQARENIGLREAVERGQQECLRQIQTIAEELTAAERSAQANLEMLRDGRLGMPARARALRMLRSGMAPDTAAVELGLPKNEVRLLAKVSGILAPIS